MLVSLVAEQLIKHNPFLFRNFPDFYYKKSYKLDNTNISVDFIMTDSIILCGNTVFETYSQPSLDPTDRYRSEKHWKWLEDTLKSSK